MFRPTARPARSRRAFSLMELLVVVGILVVLCSIFIPYVSKVREMNRRVACANNLRAIYSALAQYSDRFGRDLPRVAADPDRPARYVAFTGADWVRPPPAASTTAETAVAPNRTPVGVEAAVPAPPVATPQPTSGPASAPASQPALGAAATRPIGPPAPSPGSVQYNDVTACLWLLVQMDSISPALSPQVFVCPSTSDTPDPMLTGGRRVRPSERSNFTSGDHLSYSYSSPFTGAPRFRLNSDTLPPDFAILADKNPGVTDMTGMPKHDSPALNFARINSRNHSSVGQNVLYVTGSVQFQKTPYCGNGVGWARDNIYTAFSDKPLPAGVTPAPQAPGVLSRNAGPAWPYDSYLVPTASE